MAILKRLNEYSYILESDKKEKIGVVVDYTESSSEKNGIEFFNKAGTMKFNSIAELEEIIKSKIKIEERENLVPTETTKSIDDYPVNETDSIHDIQDDTSTGLKTFSKSKRSKKRFYPGWWIVQSTEATTFTPRLTISVDTYNAKELNTTLYGPFKTFMEVTFEMKKL